MNNEEWKRIPHAYRRRPGRPRADGLTPCKCGEVEAHSLHSPEAVAPSSAQLASMAERRWSPEDTAERFFPGRTPRQIRGMIHRGELPNAVKSGRSWLIPESDIANFGRPTDVA